MTKKLRRAMAAELSEICDIKKKLFLYYFPSSFSIICFFFRLISGGNIIGMFAIGIIIGRIESHKNSAININGANRSGSIVSIKQIFRICSLEYSSVYIYCKHGKHVPGIIPIFVHDNLQYPSMKTITFIIQAGIILTACLGFQTVPAQNYEISNIVQSRAGDLKMMRPVGFKQFIEDFGAEGEVINVYPDVEYQEMLGFGGAITETSAYNFMKLSESRRNELAKVYFDATEGLGLNFCRVSIGSNDFALDDSPYVSNNDPKLTTFSIDRDRRYVIPMIKAAQRYCGELYLMATPWSPPAFMKDNGKTINGGKLLPEHRNTWADYIVRFLQEYKKEGINFFCMTVQNEPKASQKWQSCLYSGKEEGEYAVDFLKPHLDKAGFDTLKLIVWDHNKERVLERASESFAVPKARKAIWGVAFHWYSGKHFDQLRMTHERFPEKHLILSEFCKGPATGGTHVPYGDWSDAEDYCAEMIGDFNNYACASIDWNMIVDTKGGPCLYRDDIGGGKASVVADAENNSFELQSTYYAVGHFSKYVKRGARRIGNSTYDDNLLTSSFKNPDGSIAVIVLNKGNNNLRPLLRMNGKIMRLNLPRHSITTVSIKSKGAK